MKAPNKKPNLYGGRAVLNLLVDPALRAKVVELAKQEHRAMSAQAVVLIEEALRARAQAAEAAEHKSGA